MLACRLLAVPAYFQAIRDARATSRGLQAYHLVTALVGPRSLVAVRA